MKHQQYETWIFEADELSSEQAQQLEEHLRQCEACNELAKAEKSLQMAIKSAPMMKPMSGFVRRWKMKLHKERLLRHHRQTAVILGLLSFGACALFLPLLLQTFLVLLSPEEFLIDIVKEIAGGITNIGLVGEFALTVLSSMFETVPLFWWVAMALVFSGLGIVLLFSLSRVGLIPIKKGVQK
jgi:hypothetical protein